MARWREDLEEKRKRQERQRELLKKLAGDKNPVIQTGAEFLARKKESEEGQQDAFSKQPPAERLLLALRDAERKQTPAGPCIVRRIVIPVDLSVPAGPLDFAALQLEQSAATTTSASPGDETSARPVVPPKPPRQGGRTGRRPEDYSDVWPDDRSPDAGRVAESGSDAADSAPPPTNWDAYVDDPDWGDWTAPDSPPPPPLAETEILEDIPRFRRALNRARNRSPKPDDETPEDPADRFPPIDYQCCPGFPSSVADAALLARLAQGESEETALSLENILFLDTETTGLAGGTGTFPFLTGVGYFEGLGSPDPVFVVEQYFMEDFCYEEAQLSLVAERLSRFTALCTYNGKTFDVPLLRTRYIFNRRSPSDWDLPHIDLLHVSRRLWRGVLPSVSLGTVERAVLGVRRERDIDGALIPRMYFQFTRGVRPEQMVPVFDHNVQDIASLGALLLRLCGYFDNPDHPSLAVAGELTGLGLWFDRQGEKKEAVQCFRRAVAVSTDADEQDRLLSHLARIHKRAAQWDEAVDIWTRLLERPIGSALAAAIELAKYWEHRAKDVERAQAVVRAAISRLETDQETRALLGRPDAPDLRKSPSDWLEDLEHRLLRLDRRAKKDSRNSVKENAAGKNCEGERPFPS